MTDSVATTTLGDRASRHGILHGRALGYGTRRRAAQSFAFLAACVEILVASFEELPLSYYDGHEMPDSETPPLLCFARTARRRRSCGRHDQRAKRTSIGREPTIREFSGSSASISVAIAPIA